MATDVHGPVTTERAATIPAGATPTSPVRVEGLTRSFDGRAVIDYLQLDILSGEFANRLVDDLDADTIAAAQSALGRGESVGQQRMLALHGGSHAGLDISPNLWAGVGLVRGGAATALVGRHGEVVDRIEEYHALGIEHFVLSGYPHLEEAYGFGEGVIPDLAARGLLPRAGVGGDAPLLVASGR